MTKKSQEQPEKEIQEAVDGVENPTEAVVNAEEIELQEREEVPEDSIIENPEDSVIPPPEDAIIDSVEDSPEQAKVETTESDEKIQELIKSGKDYLKITEEDGFTAEEIAKSESLLSEELTSIKEVEEVITKLKQARDNREKGQKALTIKKRESEARKAAEKQDKLIDKFKSDFKSLMETLDSISELDAQFPANSSDLKVLRVRKHFKRFARQLKIN